MEHRAGPEDKAAAEKGQGIDEQYMDMLENAMTAFWEHFDAFREQLPEQLQPFLLQFQQGFSDILFALVNQSAPTSLFSAVPHFFLSFFVALISAYFFTKGPEAQCPEQGKQQQYPQKRADSPRYPVVFQPVREEHSVFWRYGRRERQCGHFMKEIKKLFLT